MKGMLLGAIVMASIVVGMFFLRFWRSTGDRFFLFFSLSFFIEGFNRILMGTGMGLQEDSPLNYLIRLVSYGLILWAIFDKNKPTDKHK